MRLISRMQFLLDWISFVSPRSHLATALATRLSAMRRSSKPFELDESPLRRGNGEPIDYPIIDMFGHSTFFATKSRVSNGPAGGIVVRISEDQLFFVGFREDFREVGVSPEF